MIPKEDSDEREDLEMPPFLNVPIKAVQVYCQFYVRHEVGDEELELDVQQDLWKEI